MVLSILNYFHKVHDHKWHFFFWHFWSIKCNIAKNAISSGRNENLRPLLKENVSKYQTTKLWYCGSGEAFQVGHSSINQQTNSTGGISPF